MPDENGGRPKTSGRLAYDAGDIRAVLGARKKMRVATKEIGEMTPKELAYHGLTTRSHRHRMACVSELLARLSAHEVCPMLNSLPVNERGV